MMPMMPFPPVFEYHSSYHEMNLVLFAVLAVAVLAVLAVSGTLFVLKAFGLYRIATRRGIHKAWLSWLPVGQDWIRGSISDQYRYFHDGKIQHRRAVLTVLSAVYLVFSLVGIGSVLHHIFSITMGIWGYGRPEIAGYHMARLVLAGGGLGFVTTCAWIARTVFHHVCMYDLYASADPKNDAAMTLLAILLPILEPVFLIYVRDKDEGMPPRKPAGAAARPAEEPVDASYDEPSREGPEQL